MGAQSLLNDELITVAEAAPHFTDEETKVHREKIVDPGSNRFREEGGSACRSPYPNPPATGLDGARGLALSLPFTPPRAVLTQAVTEVWAGWARAEVTLVSPSDTPSISGACGHSLGNALGQSLGFPASGGGESWQRDNGS